MPALRLNDLLSRYRKLLRAPNAYVVDQFLLVLNARLGMSMEVGAISYERRSRVLRIKRQGPEKTEILLHARELLGDLRLSLGEKDAPTAIL